ncbi:MAG: glycosyltransferase, partial [Planctomycetia bacterium]|nr:glycosyltransferase [Planctomycetia bacterium]
PKVSIGVPVHNGGRYLAETLPQLLGQDYRNLELIISDNASTDDTEAICREIGAGDSRVRYYRQPTNTGIGRNWGFVCQQATGSYFLWAAHDDQWSPNAVSALVQALEEEPEAVLAFPQNCFINDRGETVIDCSQLPDLAGPLPLLQRAEHVLWFEEGAQKGNLVHGMMRTEAIQRVGIPTLDGTDFPDWGGDQLIVLAMALEGYFVHVPEAQFRKQYFPARRYDADDLVEHLREITGYFARQRRLITGSTLASSSKAILLTSLAARETTWCCRVMCAKNTGELRKHLATIIEYGETSIESRPGLQRSISSSGNTLTSIVILNYNGRQHLPDCLQSIAKYTDSPYEVILFDNASTDGSREYLRKVPNITLVESPVNLGCPPGRAQALSLAQGDFVVLLDNDTMVTPGWLRRFLDHLHAHPDIGMLGPRSNYVSGSQLAPTAKYSSHFELNQFAKLWSWNAERIQPLVPTHRLVGFCMCVRREVIDKIGGFDARFGKFGFEDDDFTLRALVAGYRAMIANDVFIHHTGGPQTRGDTAYNIQLAEAWMTFKQKWGIPLTLACGEPYDLKSIVSQTFDPAKHYVPIPDATEVSPLIYRSDSPATLRWQDSSHPHVFSKRPVFGDVSKRTHRDC